MSQDSKLVESLKERVKELTCLYEISRISANSDMTLDEKLVALAQSVSKAWKYHKVSVVEIMVMGQHYRTGKTPLKSVCQKSEITTDDSVSGWIRVHYPADTYSDHDFLPEELQLLQKVSSEIGVIIESDQRKSKEELLKRTAERADRLSILGEITAGIAHELNTPLGNILGFAQFIKDSDSEPQVIRDAEKIENSANYAREVVKKLMFFSCEMPQQMESRRINPLVAEAIKLLRPTLLNSHVEIEYIPDAQDPFIQVDPIQITQVVFNLVLNAIHASPEQSRIIARITSDVNDVCIHISDRGKGVAKDIQHRIFEPFFSTRASGEGSGLGLSVVHGIVKSHKGKIEFDTETGKGTTFCIYLPKAQ